MDCLKNKSLTVSEGATCVVASEAASAWAWYCVSPDCSLLIDEYKSLSIVCSY